MAETAAKAKNAHAIRSHAALARPFCFSASEGNTTARKADGLGPLAWRLGLRPRFGFGRMGMMVFLTRMKPSQPDFSTLRAYLRMPAPRTQSNKRVTSS